MFCVSHYLVILFRSPSYMYLFYDVSNVLVFHTIPHTLLNFNCLFLYSHPHSPLLLHPYLIFSYSAPFIFNCQFDFSFNEIYPFSQDSYSLTDLYGSIIIYFTFQCVHVLHFLYTYTFFCQWASLIVSNIWLF